MHPIDVLFWACLMLGGVYTLFNLLMGGLSHAAGHASHIGHTLHLPHIPDIAGHVGGHAEAAHTAGGAHAMPGAHGHGARVHVPHAHIHAGHGTHAGADLEDTGPRFNLMAYLNPLAVAAFLLGFGGAGVLIGLLNPAVGAYLRLAFSGVSGWGLWLASYLLVSRVFGYAEGTSHNTRDQCIGLPAQVTAPISGATPGMISYTVAGARQTLCAISEEPEPIPVGATVRIRKITANTAHVIVVDQPISANVRQGA